MIVSVAHASVDDSTSANVFGAWSDLVVGSRPQGLLDCLLLEAGDNVQIVALWESQEHHDSAIEDEGTHPAFTVFEASGLDPTHTTWSVVGRIDIK